MIIILGFANDSSSQILYKRPLKVQKELLKKASNHSDNAVEFLKKNKVYPETPIRKAFIAKASEVDWAKSNLPRINYSTVLELSPTQIKDFLEIINNPTLFTQQ